MQRLVVLFKMNEGGDVLQIIPYIVSAALWIWDVVSSKPFLISLFVFSQLILYLMLSDRIDRLEKALDERDIDY